MELRICLSIGNVEFEEVLQQLRKVELAEIRMDLLGFTDEQFKTIFQRHRNLIATFRLSESDYLKLSRMLTLAIESGCAFIDIDVSTPNSYRDALVQVANKRGVKVILSYHNFTETPSIEKLRSIVDDLFLFGADIAKVACMANSPADCARMLGLYEKHQNMVVFSMGQVGKVTRLASPMLGAPFTYASIKGKETAPGQLAFEEVEKFFNSIL